jgi:hypothetical protein
MNHDHDAQRFEDGRVRMLLRHLNLAHLKPILLSRHKEKYGDYRLTFDELHAVCPDLPVRFTAVSTLGVTDSFQASMLLRWQAYQYFEQVYEVGAASFPDSRVGVVMGFPGLRGGAVIHAQPWRTNQTTLSLDRGVVGRSTLKVEPYIGFLKYLAGQPWQDDELLPSFQPTICMTATHVRELGSGPAVIVWGALLSLLTTTEREGFVRKRLSTSAVGLSMGRPFLSHCTGLSFDAIKRGVRTLVERNYVRCERKGSATTYIVNHEKLL